MCHHVARLLFYNAQSFDKVFLKLYAKFCSLESKYNNTIKGSAQATQVALAHTMAQWNPTVKRGLAKQPKIKKLPKGQASDKMTQTKEKEKSQ